MTNRNIDDTADVKACCADLYSSDLARWLLGDSFHPGGLALTRRLGELLDLGPDSYLIDVASGRGTSAIHLAEQFGCRVLGIDYSEANVEIAREAAYRSSAGGRVEFLSGDAEQLPLPANTFDALICECSFCTFPDKAVAAREFARVLRSGGRIGFSDLTRKGELPPELDNILGHIMCIAEALPAESYAEQLAGAGFHINTIESHNESLQLLISQVRTKLIGGSVLVHTQSLTLPDFDLKQAHAAARHAAEEVSKGTLGYAIITGFVPED